jgi:hypothetical protein
MIDYRKIWASINNESKNSTTKSQIARRVPSKGNIPVFLATDFIKGIRLLYIKLDIDHKINPDHLPCFRGLEISLTCTSVGEFINQEFLKFTQSIPGTPNIFELVVSDICDKIIQIDKLENLNPILIRVLNEWKVFFEKQESEILSVHAQEGLVGELHFLKDFLFPKYTFVEALNFWTGSDKTNHDFQLLNKAIEVKTTAGKQHKKFSVSSERQLDNTGLEHLFLVVYSLNLHNNIPDLTLPALIEEINAFIENDPIASFQLQIKLIKYGYNNAHSEKYNVGFSVFETRFFEVIENFPRLLQNNLPNGVGDLKYSVVVAACNPFEITTDFLNYI